MPKIKCPICGNNTIKSGKTNAGKQRWKCCRCGVTFINKIDNSSKQFNMFLKWLFGKQAQNEMKGGGRTFRRQTSSFWNIWALPPKIEYSSEVVYVDGIYLSRKLCVLICCNNKHVLGWYVCRYEHASAWEALMKRIAAPRVVISDGGTGFNKALMKVWPNSRHQRCLFHAFSQVRRYTTLKPQTRAGRDLYIISKDLLHVKSPEEAIAWIKSFDNWIDTYKDFIAQKSRNELGQLRFTHERLVKAKNSLIRLIKQDTLFTYIDEQLKTNIQIPSTNNRIEGGVNSQLRDLLRRHRGLPLDRRLKAVYWWCYMHSPKPLPITEILKCMPTDESISKAFQEMYDRGKVNKSIPNWGDGLVWNELHRATIFPSYWD